MYVYEDTNGDFVCERCPSVGHEHRCATAAEMVAHLLEHRGKGQRVPDDALDELTTEGS